MKSRSSNLRILAVTVLLAALAAFPGLGQKEFSGTASVVVVEVPVTVTRDGAPVDDLTAANFEISDKKKKQELTGFEFIDLREIDSIEPIGRPLPIAARRHFLMLFDLAWSKPEAMVEARRAARDLVSSLHPADLAGVALFTSTQGADLLLNFTSDRRQLELAIESLGVPTLVEQANDPLRLVFGSVAGENESDSGAGEIAEEKLLETLGRLAAAERAARLDRVTAFTGHLEALADLLSSVEGRKHVVYFSAGLPDELLLGKRELADTVQGGLGKETEADSGAWLGEVASQSRLADVIERFRRADCAIQAVDVSGLGKRRGRRSGKESLGSLARGTGGDLFHGFEHLGEAMRRVLDETTVTYLLAFQPGPSALDGEYHALGVDLVDVPRGTRVFHRAGYRAPEPFDATAQGQVRLETAELIMSEEEGGPIGLEVLAVPFPVEGQKTYVPVLLEIDGKSLATADAPEQLELEVYAYAWGTETGRVHDFFVQPIGLDLAKVGTALEQTGVKYWGHFDLPPGRYTARVMVRDQHDGRYTVKRHTMTVPSPETSDALLLPPLFPEPAGKWLLVREGEDRQRDVPYPFMARGQPYVPAARPVVPSEGSTPFHLRGFHLSDQAGFQAMITSAEGRPVDAAALKLAPPTAASGSFSVAAELETRGLEPGEYTLIGRAVGAAGQRPSCSIRFVVR